ncbi:hypothetical protein HPG69_016216 [Diceros bicornis minor]|uniref:Cytochrome c oxidase subunit 3 n=1 Tax=Diceros bicornis minor TaxID=77932 RepID=A0A7J7FHY0_DICBM|nr:hypothetical protein HPG69_016216 [Diceros bicornis minor]
MEGNRKHTLQALFITISLGIDFTLLQASEYYEAPFTSSDGVYGSTLFIATGFHGLHVIIGSTFLILCFPRQLKFHFTSSHHFGLEAACDYSCTYPSIDEVPILLVSSKKSSPYACGFDPIGSARLPFSIKFFLVAITFLLFDLEIALLLPLPWASQTTNLKTILTTALILISLLAASLAYE